MSPPSRSSPWAATPPSAPSGCRQAGEYSESFFSHGLSVQTAEGAGRIRAPAGSPRARDRTEEGGKRYSWGYPACPDLAQHETVVELLDARSINIRLTEGFQFDPEQTTAALIVPHPDAKYYALARSGGDDE